MNTAGKLIAASAASRAHRRRRRHRKVLHRGPDPWDGPVVRPTPGEEEGRTDHRSALGHIVYLNLHRLSVHQRAGVDAP